MTRRSEIGALLLLLAALGTGVAAHAQERDSAPDAAHSAAMFTKQCASCHTAPDSKLATDRAWLKQVADTA